ncbi:MAG: hypothetical protein EKK62_17060 [Acidimicrobiia bacterium]|nr:MAG: hypothetical protein EKK62_17060 [Acidimicrobiia bacterium]
MRQRNQAENAAAVFAAIEEHEATARRLELQRAETSATAETLRADMWVAVRFSNRADEDATA